ncbi:MAG: diguanylate cyclase (GGDEF)-like protein/PAS domain S-box-containing protein [Halocynthiibacter sp.]
MHHKPSQAKDSEPVLAGLGTFAGLFADLPDGVLVTSTDRRILWMNASAEKIFGYSQDELRGQATKSLYADKDDHKENAKHLTEIRQRSSTSHFFMNFMRKNGEVFEAELTGSGIRGDDGELLGYLGIIRDISETYAIENVIHALYEISSNHEHSSERKIEEILRLGCTHFNLPTGIVSWIEGQEYTVLYALSSLASIPTGTSFELGRTYCTHTLAADAPIGFHDARHSSICMHPCYADFGLDAYLGIPLIVDGQRFGTLNFSGPVPTNEFSETDYDLMKLFAAWVAQELSAANARIALEHEANTDPLTGCLNRRAWMREARELLHPQDEAGGPIRGAKAVVAFDLDEFKAVNDIYGHAVGDEVLKTVIEICKKEPALEGMPLGRLGGEEFCIFLSGEAAKTVDQLAERLRASIDRMRIVSDGRNVRCSASFGICRVSDPNMTLENCMKRADLALYRAKSGGRNLVWDCAALTASDEWGEPPKRASMQ